ncbi:hypothetical protein EMGBS4_05040 [Acidimicrobiaceae bacterium]|nr:hypothetical protein EMGBS4_05040 [Acidimicrobiaceae bacterium]
MGSALWARADEWTRPNSTGSLQKILGSSRFADLDGVLCDRNSADDPSFGFNWQPRRKVRRAELVFGCLRNFAVGAVRRGVEYCLATSWQWKFVKDYFVSFRLIDLLGIPIGVLSQVFLVGLVTWPFHLLFPEKFDPKNVEKRARDLFDNANGIWLVVLVIVVVFGAPIVEELVYRGLIQGHLRESINKIAALLLTAVWFAGIHLQIVEFPGLLAFALVLGTCFHFTNRLGMSVVSHIAFNATGLILVAML